MPELPEAETVAAQVREMFQGRKLRGARLWRRDILRAGSLSPRCLVGNKVCRVERVGKCVVLRFGSAGSLVVHMGMTGRLLVGEDRKKSRPLHTHACFQFGGGVNLYYQDPRRFGYLLVTKERSLEHVLGLGKDPFAMKPGELRGLLAGRKAPIKAVLLDQKLISGIGNIYADEILFSVGIHPHTPAGEVAAMAASLLSAARRILAKAIAHRGTTFRDYRDAGGRRGSFQSMLRVYAREGLPCRRCRTIVEKIRLQGRSTHFCPRCQRGKKLSGQW